mgnify:FL=1
MNILEEIQNCPVEWKELGEVCEIVRGNGLQKKDFVDEGIPCIHYGQIYTYYSSYVYKTKSFVSISLSEKLKKAQTGDIIVATTSENIEDVGKSIVWLGDGDVCIGGHSCIIKTNENPKYINYYMQSIFFQKQKEKQVIGTKVIELYPKNLSKIKIPIPPIEIQEKIVQKLDKMTEYVTKLTSELTSELTSRKKQYSFYRDKLLSFEDEVYQVEWKTLGEVAKFNYGYTDKAKETGDIRFIRITDIDENGYLKSNDKKYISLTEESRNYLVKHGDLLMARTGATYGKTLFIDTDETSAYASFLIKITLSEKLNSRYYWHFSKSELYWKQANNLVSKAGQPQFNANSLKNVKIPIPSLEIQSRIIQVLDNFDTVCNDLNIGLPKEIELRQKQYEYFRDKLLTFTAEGVYTDSTVQTRHH